MPADYEGIGTGIPSVAYNFGVAWEVEYTDEFGNWWETLSISQQEDVDAHVRQLERRGPHLPFPYSSAIQGSRHNHMRELRVQSGGRPLRIFYAFDPRRTAILLIGGDKTGDNRFYHRYIPIADALYDVHLAELAREAAGEDERNERKKTMAGRRSFATLRNQMSPESQARATAKASQLQGEMDLAELRRARQLSQEEIARTLHVGQAAVAKLEKRTDLYLSTLRRFVEAMGGQLTIIARFPDHDVQIRQLRDLQGTGPGT